MYYRVAIQMDERDWRWVSTVLSSLDTIFRFLRLYRAFPQDRLRVFSSSSRESLHEQLARENSGRESHSVTAAQQTREGQEAATCRDVGSSLSSGSDMRFQRVESTHGLDSRRLEVERGAGSDHDLPYQFTFPHLWLQALAWAELLAKVQCGLEP